MKHFDKAKTEPVLVAERNLDDIPKVIKVLSHKIHGGRKKDSKFWSIENDLSERDFKISLLTKLAILHSSEE